MGELRTMANRYEKLNQYEIANLVYHLSQLENADPIQELLLDFDWLRTERDLDPSLSSYLADVEIGIEYAEREDPPDYATVAALSLIAARTKEQVQDVPLEALSALVYLGRWKQAVAYVGSIEPPERRLYAQRQMAELLQEIGDQDGFRFVVTQGLQYARELDPALEQITSAAISLESSFSQIEERCNSDELTDLVELTFFFGTWTDRDKQDEYKNFLSKGGIEDGRFVLLKPRFSDTAKKQRSARALRDVDPFDLSETNFPPADDLTRRDYEISPKDLQGRYISVKGESYDHTYYEIVSGNLRRRTITDSIDVELVRGIAAELYSLID